ncbi:MAG: DUF1269 domain-containing protein [Anaerolineales bacterium]|jgi:uncharacterized membrane protein
MANIVALMFEGAETAESMLDNFMEMQTKGIIELEDAVVASRGPGSNVNFKQTHSITGKYTLRGSGVGLLAGLLLGGPIGGLVGGAAVGAIAGKMKDVGIDDDFIKNTSTALAPNTSAIFLMIKEANAEEVLAQLKPFKATVLTSTLTEEQEQVLRKTLEREE